MLETNTLKPLEINELNLGQTVKWQSVSFSNTLLTQHNTKLARYNCVIREMIPLDGKGHASFNRSPNLKWPRTNKKTEQLLGIFFFVLNFDASCASILLILKSQLHSRMLLGIGK